MNRTKSAILLALGLISSACMKNFLDVKRDKSQVVPNTLADYQAIFDHNNLNNYFSYQLGEIGSDDYYITNEQWQGLSNPIQKNAYIWADEIYQGESGEDWNRGYEKILLANFVLEGVNKIDETFFNKPLRDELIGASLFYRGCNLFLLAQLFCKQYEKATIHDELGLPLRVSSNINSNYQRATLAETYTQILNDLEKSSILLPSQMSVNTRPWKAAAWGMLADVYLQIGDYQMASKYADSTLSLASELIDYNEVDTLLNAPFPQYGQGNAEIIFFSQMTNTTILSNARLIVDSLLYDSYEKDDLRRKAFFFDNGGRTTFKGHYSGVASFMFSGLTTSEMLLVRSECNARLGEIEDSIMDLNRLLSNRFKSEAFIPFPSDLEQDEVLNIVLSERRKELIYRGRRWHDLKRFANDPDFSKPLIRVLDDKIYELPLNSSKWVWPIPPNAINEGGYQQNERH